MTQFVMDNSVLAAWALGEPSAYAARAVDKLRTAGAIVPAIWPVEFANAILTATRKKRITQAQAERILALVAELDVHVALVDVPRVFGHVTALAARHGLTVYDATYLDLAMTHGAGLATLDAKLARAAADAGVEDAGGRESAPAAAKR